MKVLIVDDSSRMREMMRRYLPADAGEICECEDGIDALACYENFLPDWVLMDWEMKRMNGLKATKKIVGKFPEAKILLVTQHDDIELREAATEAGACGFVLKEDLAKLRQFLTALLEPE
jgi:two-component system response regulator DegU